MKYIRKFDDKDEILNISESFAEGFSIPCTFNVYEFDNYKRYDVYFYFLQSGLYTSEFNQKRKSFETRINALGYEILYNNGRIVSQSDPFITFGKQMTSLLVMLQKFYS